MTITTRVQLHCDVGLKCTKEIARTVEGPNAGARIRHWAVAEGWGTWGDRDACPACWKELHSATRQADLDALCRDEVNARLIENAQARGTVPAHPDRINRFVEVAMRDQIGLPEYQPLRK